MAWLPGSARCGLAVLVALLLASHTSAQGCPAANSVDGIFATGYPLSDGEILTPGSLSLPASFTTREPEQAGLALASQTLTITCANISGNGCDGVESTTPGVQSVNSSMCMGCAGPVSVAVLGVGHGNASRFGSTCLEAVHGVEVTCSPDGIPHVNGNMSTGVWNATGTCQADKGMGQGSCGCDVSNGDVTIPLGPWNLTAGSDRRCECAANGTVYPPAVWYNVSFTTADSFYNATVSNETCSVGNCTCDASGVSTDALGYCGCACELTAYYCSPSNCTCGDGSPKPLDGTPTGDAECNCGCVPVQETVEENHCECHRESCSDCHCDKVCTAGCAPDPCGFTNDTHGKVFTSTGGNNCTVQASCAGGFFGGRSFTALNSPVKANLKKDGVDLEQGYLTGHTANLASGSVAFPAVTVKRTASETKGYTLFYGVTNSTGSQVLLSVETPVFKVAANYFKVHQAASVGNTFLTAPEYLVGAQQTASLGAYNITLFEQDGATAITLVDSADGFTASLILLTATDGGHTVRYNTAGADVGRVSDGLEAHQAGVVTEKLQMEDGGHMGFELSVKGTFGVAFQIGIHLNSTLTVDKTRDAILQAKMTDDSGTVHLSPFSISPNSTVVHFGADDQVYSPDIYPKVVHQSAHMWESDVPGEGSGLPGSLVVHFVDSEGNDIKSAFPSCSQCVHARLVQCTDSMSAQEAYPACAAVTQARCATSSPGKCGNTGVTGDPDWRDTLSGVTTVDMANGTATFTNLTIEHTWGAGFRLEFTLSPTNPLAFHLASSHTTGSVTVPDARNPPHNNSFFIRPYSLAVVQQPGGDGVDIDHDGHADGTGESVKFRRQPVVIIMGKGYANNGTENNNGYTPVQALIHAQRCGAEASFAADCAIDLTGLLTPPAAGAPSFSASADGPSAGEQFAAFGDAGGQVASLSATKPQMLYSATLRSAGLMYKDLTLVPTNNSKPVRQDVVLEFRVGPHVLGLEDTYIFARSSPMDVFQPPNAATNVRATSVGKLGFRIDFDPPVVTRSSPLSGFLVEVVRCSQAESQNTTCITQANPNFPSSYGFTTRLGTDLSRGGGYTQETILKWGAPDADGYLSLELVFIAHKTLLAGDSLLIELGPRVHILDAFVSPCVLEGLSAASFAVDASPESSTLSLTVAATVYEDAMVTIAIPATCHILTPGGSAANSFAYLYDFQAPDTTSQIPQMGASSLPRLLHAPVMGALGSVRFDNCKGTATCTKLSSFSLPSIQDGSSMDLDWFGGLRHGGVGALTSGGYVASYGEGPNGAPVAGASAFSEPDELCRAGKAFKNPCALSVSHDWTDMLEMEYVPAEEGSVTSFVGVVAKIRRTRALVEGDQITFTVPFTMTMPGAAACALLAANFTNATSGESAAPVNSTADPACGFLRTSVSYRGVSSSDWTSTWTADAHSRDNRPTLPLRTFAVTVPRSMPGLNRDEIAITITGFTATAEIPAGSRLPKFTSALLRRARRTSLVFRDGALVSSSTPTALDPHGTYLEGVAGPGFAKIIGGGIYSFKVTAYNGRFRGPVAETKVHNRATMPPAAPALFTQMSQEAVGVKLLYSNLIGQVASTPFPQYTSTLRPSPGETTRIGVRIKPRRRVGPGESFTLRLPGFTSLVPTLIFNSTGPYKILADTYQVTNFSRGFPTNESKGATCACDAAGTTFTPRNLYSITNEATGLGQCNSNASANASIDNAWCECGGCGCSLAGVVSTPPTTYDEHFNCSANSVGCSCDHSTGAVTLPPTEYTPAGDCPNEAGNETLCACSAAGATISPDFHAVGQCDNCSCSGHGVAPFAADGVSNCSACACEFRECNCACVPVVCECSCPINVTCGCGCPIAETFECGCEQSEHSLQISRAVWSTYTSALTLTVAPDSALAAGVATTFWFDRNGGLIFPPGSVVPLGPAGLSGTEAVFNRFKLNWVSPFPTALRPRLGFIVQMTSDIYWRTDVQTFFVRDELDEGSDRLAMLTQLAKPIALTDKFIDLLAAQEHLHRGDILKIGSEYMQVQGLFNMSASIEVLRGVLGSDVQAHALFSGGDACGCAANNSATGGAGCVCTVVSKKQRGATDVGIDNDGLDTATGFLGVQCRRGKANALEGCNPTGYLFNGSRTFQSFEITDSLTLKYNFYGACGTDSEVCASGNCLCNVPDIVPGAELGNFPATAKGFAKIRNTGDPLGYPTSVATSTVHMVLGDSTVTNIAVKDAGILTGKYIRIDDEIMLVSKVSRGVVKVATSRAYGGSLCSCTSVGGTASGGTSCSCAGATSVNCTAGGTLTGQGGQGVGFKGTFNVSDGSVSSIHVTNPGAGYSKTGPIVSILGDVSECVFSGSAWFVTTTAHVLSVTRAALGTIRGEHAANAPVSFVPWPTYAKVSTHSPGLQYHFRIAAVSNAGVSPFLYHALKLYSVFPRVIPGIGGTEMEITLIGGHVTAANITIYIGQTNPDGSPDYPRSKKCSSVVNLDAGGTRLTCSSPAGNGASWDLIAVSRSGSVQRLEVGTGWIRYSIPEISTISPAQVDPGADAVFTIAGKNFGKARDPLTGYLDASTGPIPCTPLEHISDNQAICYIFPKTGEVMTGHIILTAGNLTTGGGQDTATSVETTYIKEKPAPVEVKATIAVDIAAIAEGTPARTAFVASFLGDISSALGVPASRLEVTGIVAGSVIVVFNIIPDASSTTAPSPAALAVSLAVQAADPASALRATSLGGSITVAIPPGTAELAAAEAAETEVTGDEAPLWETNCVPKTYTAFDMDTCYDCCRYTCETGVEKPQVGGQDVLPGYRGRVCQAVCMKYCGFGRAVNISRDR